MNATPHPSLFVTLSIAVLIAWRMYYRIRRLVGRQTFSRKRAIATVTLLPLVLALLLFATLASVTSLLALAAGVGVGTALGIYGLRLTRFDETPAGLFYTPGAHLGVALSLLLVGRIGYRLVQLYMQGPQASSQVAFVSSPVTLVIFGSLAGYYVSYALGLLKWAGRSGEAVKAAHLQR